MNPVDSALRYAARGWAVFPCHTITAAACSCGQPDCSSPGKHPLTRRGLHNATTDDRQVRRWWSRRPDANIAIRTGEQSGLVVIDIDPRHAGDHAWRTLEAEHGPIDTLQSATGGGGTHLYLQHPGTPLPNSAGRLGDGIDIRGDGGYVLAPPSQHASGQRYRWTNALHPASVPRWVVDALQPPKRSMPTQLSSWTGRADRWAEAALLREADRVRTAAEGTRNNTLNHAAFRIGQITGARLIDSDVAERVLVEAALTAGLDEREARTTSRSGLNAGSKHPRAPDRGVGAEL